MNNLPTPRQSVFPVLHSGWAHTVYITLTFRQTADFKVWTMGICDGKTSLHLEFLHTNKTVDRKQVTMQ